ncbi:MAG TPA: glycosyltransferase [Pyrinomonadaceae bacterium]|jgi:polysaccharide deacetylase family protein (PEP-CTERM system associated)|nr:glycosyltransferase [Pyrinomonadaceae bacterium]
MSLINEKKQHLLTVLVEDYFHVGAFEKLIHQRQWQHFDPRYERNTMKTLDLLDEFKVKASFFVLGWIAEQNPKLIREIAARGHEVASRGYYHRSLHYLTNEEFREDLRRANGVLEDACGQKVIGYRSAEKLSYKNDAWVLDVLAEEGLLYDTSFLPKAGDSNAKRFAHQHHSNGRVLWEFPYSTQNLGGYLLPISGGNYFRQIPYTMLKYAVRDWHEKRNAPFMLYFHVWELDPEQPRINAASSYNRIRHYRKLDKMEWVIKEYFRRYDFVCGAQYLGVKEQAKALEAKPGPAIEKIVVSGKTSKARIPVTVVIPCYNEEPTLPYLANTLRSVEQELSEKYAANFIFVDDKSSDNTAAKIEELFADRPNVRLIRHEENKGVAAGILTGLRAAETEIVCSMDCDCTYDPHELVKMIPLLSDGPDKIDMVTASPYHPKGGVRNVPEWRLFLSKGASFLYRRVLRSKLSTYTSCFRIYRRSALASLEIKENGFLGVAEMLGKLDLSGGKIAEYPAVLEVRLFGFSKMKTARTILGHLKLLSYLLRLRWATAPVEDTSLVKLEKEPSNPN